MTITQMESGALASARERNLYRKDHNVLELLCEIHSEVSEAMVAYQKGEHAREPLCKAIKGEHATENITAYDICFLLNYKDTFEDELADIVLRTASLCGYLGIDLEHHVEAKMTFNSRR